MLSFYTESVEYYDELKNEFFIIPSKKMKLEHSLISVSKWESKWCIPFLDTKDKTSEQLYDYIEFMSITPIDDRRIIRNLSKEQIINISNYINSPMTATKISGDSKSGKTIITSELIYYWMVTFGIPFECEKWHLNRLLTLINICSEKNKPSKKMGKNEILKNNKALNDIRRAKLNSRG